MAGGAAAGLWYDAAAETNVEAALDVMGHMDFEVAEHASDALAGKVIAHNADRDRIVVAVDANEGSQSSRVTVRVGFKDGSAARHILEAIVAKL